MKISSISVILLVVAVVVVLFHSVGVDGDVIIEFLELAGMLVPLCRRALDAGAPPVV